MESKGTVKIIAAVVILILAAAAYYLFAMKPVTEEEIPETVSSGESTSTASSTEIATPTSTEVAATSTGEESLGGIDAGGLKADLKDIVDSVEGL